MVEKPQDATLTAEEAEIYDRQIRLWGVEAQQRLRKAKILMVGLSSLGNEVAKNVLLAGVQHMTLLDHEVVTDDDCKTQFLTPYDATGKNRAESCLSSCKDLNPMVDILADHEHINTKSEEFLKKFDVVCVTNHSGEIQTKVNEICHRLGIKFLSGNVFGYYGYMFADFGKHEYLEEQPKKPAENKDKEDGPSSKKKQKKEQTETEYVEKVSDYCTLKDALDAQVFEGKSLRQAKQVSKAYLIMQVLLRYHTQHGCFPSSISTQEDLKRLLDVRDAVFEQLHVDNELLHEDFTTHCVGSMYPVNAIIGGIMAQEVIKAVSGKDTPHNNFFLYDGVATTGVVQKVAPQEREAKITKGIVEEKPKAAEIDEIIL